MADNGSVVNNYYGAGATGAAAPTNPFAWIAQLASGIGNIATSKGDMDAARQAANVADPFSSQRGAYQTQLHDYMGANSVDPSKVTGGTNDALSQLMRFMQDPSSIRDNPVYKAGLDFGTEAVNRGAGASGLINSGNRLLGLEKFGQDYGMGFENQIYNQLLGDVGANVNAANLGLNAQNQGYNELALLSGATTGNPAAAAQALMNGRANQANSVGSGIGGITNGLVSMLPMLQKFLSGGGSSFTGTSGVGLNGEQFGTGGDSGVLDPSMFTGYSPSGVDLLSGGYGPDPSIDLTSLFLGD